MSAGNELSPKDRRTIACALERMGLGANGETFEASPLSGGVSCDVWHIRLANGCELVIKRALPKLRVDADWRAPAGRSAAEADWFRLVAEVDPRLVPEVVAEDRAHHMFAMEYLPIDSHPIWKTVLAAGRAEANFAGQVGAALSRIHAYTAGREDIARDFAHAVLFRALRLEPYLLFTASKHPDLAPRIRATAERIAQSRIALMQGDISPKNILVGADGPVFLDAETASFGDPAFDLAFCLNHLLLKGAWHPEFRPLYRESFARLAQTYLEGVRWEAAGDLEERASELLPMLLLARIDGESPVEYLTQDTDKAFVRAAARTLLLQGPTSLAQIADYFAGASSR